MDRLKHSDGNIKQTSREQYTIRDMAQFGDIVLNGTGKTYEDYALSSTEKRQIFNHWLMIVKDNNANYFQFLSVCYFIVVSRLHYNNTFGYICFSHYILYRQGTV